MSCKAARTLMLAIALAATGEAAVQSDRLLADVIEAGDRKAALEMIAAGAPVDRTQPDGTTPLAWAVYRVDAELTEALLARGADPNVTNAFGSSPLAEAVKVGNVGLVRVLLAAGADANAANQDGQTPLMLAARTGVVEIARMLVSAGADVNAREAFRDQTALMWAAGSDNGDMAVFLIASGADLAVRARANDWLSQMTNEPRVQYRPSGGLTPLLYAARAGCLECVAAMAEAGADLDRPNPDGMTPMIMALDNRNYDVARYLLEHGANPNTWDWWGRTPLYVAVNMRGGEDSHPGPRPAESLDLIEALLDAGVNPDIQLSFKEPSRGGNSNRFKDDLLTTGATPLLRAAQTFDDEVVGLLVAHGARVDLPTASGVTPLMAAAGIGTRTSLSVLGPGPPENVEELSIGTLGILLDAGADVNARITDTTSRTARIARGSTLSNREGQTALFFAAEQGRAAVVRFLLDRGADADIVDASGQALIDAARGDDVLALLGPAGN